MKENLIKALGEHRVIAILRGISPDAAADTARALYDGGIRFMEVTFNQSSPTKLEDTARSIERILHAVKGDVFVGAGTVLSPEEADAAADAGATFALAPDVNPRMIEAACRRGMAAIPGAMTPTEIVTAHNLGAALVKVFPCIPLGADYIRAIAAPLNHIPLIAVGGVDEHNLQDFLKAGAIGVGVGSNIVKNALIEAGRFEVLTRLALAYTKALGR